MNLHGQVMNLQAKPYDGTDAHTHYCRGHKDARHAAAELAVKADAVVDAARAVLAWRVDTPLRGDLRDNDSSRKALRALAEAVAAFGDA